jgi:DNA-binding SARP family transcriptional activator/Tfp pilus assembly protein PilF
MRFRVLGPLEVWTGAEWSGISAGKWRSLLACLLLRPGQIVPTETLIDELWGDTPPSTATNLVSIYVHRLRRMIEDPEGRILVHRKPGYLLKVDDDDMDLQRFIALTARGRDALADGDTETAARLLAQSENLWRGTFLADVTPSASITAEAERAVERRLSATELRVRADLACGRHSEVIPELRLLVAAYPLREGLWLLLMRALDGAGRHAEALDTYGQARTMIADELGVDPGAELQQLYSGLLAADVPAVPQPRPPRGDGALSGLAGPDGTASGAAGPATGTDAAALAATAASAAAVGRSSGAGPSGGEGGPDVKDGTGGGGPRGGKRRAGVISAGAFAAGDVTADGDTSAAAGQARLADLTRPAGAGVRRPPARAHVAEDPESSQPPLSDLAQLPADIADFTGRKAQVRLLCDMLTSQDAASGPGAVRIAIVAGAAGLGKTTLAVHAAHQVSGRFPDGQLYVDLAGASSAPTAPGEVLARFLRDLGVDGDKVPASDDERAALYRSRLTGRRILILLDSARDAAQVRPLLPGSASCAVLVTTRNSTPDLVSTRFVDLNVLSDSEALTLFSRVVGDDRPASEPDATAEVLLACAGLPLAIRICAARLAARRQWRIATMANRLRDERRRLDELQIGDLEVRASFQVSYDTLPGGAGRRGIDPRRAFRLLGLWEGQKISLPAAAALIGERESDVADALETLIDANLLESPAPDWYRFHDLLRFYATERAQAEEPEQARDEAVGRLLRWYLVTAAAAADALSPRRYQVPMTQTPDVRPLTLTSADSVLQWYDSERAGVITATRQAVARGLHDIAWRLPTALYALFNRRDNWTDCVSLHRIAVDSARAAGHQRGEAWALNNLGQALGKLREKETLDRLENALAIRRETGDRVGEAQSAISLADAYHKLHGAEVAYPHSERCLEILRDAGNPSFLGVGLNNHGEFCLELGRLDEAARFFAEALDVLPDTDRYVRGHVTQNLGRVYLESGRVAEALGTLTEAHGLHLESGDLMGQATSLKFLGQAQRHEGRESAARESWTAALLIFEGLHADAEMKEIQSALAA